MYDTSFGMADFFVQYHDFVETNWTFRFLTDVLLAVVNFLKMKIVRPFQRILTELDVLEMNLALMFGMRHLVPSTELEVALDVPDDRVVEMWHDRSGYMIRGHLVQLFFLAIHLCFCRLSRIEIAFLPLSLVLIACLPAILQELCRLCDWLQANRPNVASTGSQFLTTLFVAAFSGYFLGSFEAALASMLIVSQCLASITLSAVGWIVLAPIFGLAALQFLLFYKLVTRMELLLWVVAMSPFEWVHFLFKFQLAPREDRNHFFENVYYYWLLMLHLVVIRVTIWNPWLVLPALTFISLAPVLG